MEFWRKRVRRPPKRTARPVLGMLSVGLVGVSCVAGSHDGNNLSDSSDLQAPDVTEGVMHRDEAVPWDSLGEIVYPPLPEGYKERQGMMIGDSHALSDIVRGDETFLVLSRFVAHTPAGRARWKVETALRLPPTQEGESIVWVDCSVDGLDDRTVVAIGKWRSSASADSLASIRQAWRPDTAIGAFEFINPSRVACLVFEDRR